MAVQNKNQIYVNPDKQSNTVLTVLITVAAMFALYAIGVDTGLITSYPFF